MLSPISWIKILISYVGSRVILSSYWICLIGGMIGLILYIFGYEKGKNYPLISIAMYLIINIIGQVLLNV